MCHLQDALSKCTVIIGQDSERRYYRSFHYTGNSSQIK